MPLSISCVFCVTDTSATRHYPRSDLSPLLVFNALADAGEHVLGAHEGELPGLPCVVARADAPRLLGEGHVTRRQVLRGTNRTGMKGISTDSPTAML